jgi:hypothetical protein
MIALWSDFNDLLMVVRDAILIGFTLWLQSYPVNSENDSPFGNQPMMGPFRNMHCIYKILS